MELTNEFVVAVPVEQAWAVLTDVERIAPCLPGAELQEVEGDEYRGIVKVKVGPITASYRGTARFEEKDDTAHRGVLKAEGRETRGQGNASATIIATLSPSGEGTKVEVVTDLAITGKVAQFGRGVLADVSGKLLEQFVHNLETMVLAPPASPATGAKDVAPAAPATVDDVPPAAAPAASAPGAGTAKPARSRSRSKAAASATTASTAAETAVEDKAPTAAAPAKAKDEGEKTSSGKGSAHGDETEKDVPATVAGSATAEPEPDAGGNGAAETGVADAGSATVRQIQSAPAVPVDLGRIAGPSVARRLIPFASVAGALFLIRVVVYALRRRKK